MGSVTGSMWSDEWRAVREDVLERDGHACRECPADADDVGVDRLHVHHIRARARDGPDEPANCITLCQSCHLGKHHGNTTYHDAEFVQTVMGYGPLTAREVAEWMGCDPSTARRRLKELSERGEVECVERDGTNEWHAPRSIVHRVLGNLSPF